MLEVATDAGELWDAAVDWDDLCARAGHAAVAHSPYKLLLDKAVTAEISVRLGEDEEVRALNARYRGKDAATNVLSFPMVQPDLIEGLANSDDGEVLLGDIILARGVCLAEAADKGVAPADHAAHLVVHGTLHLLGYDHRDDPAGERMEALERDALASLGIADPYAIRKD